MKLYTTLNLLEKANACKRFYQKVVKKLGLDFDKDTNIDLLDILDFLGAEDCLWCLRATTENCDKLERLMAADFAESVLHLFEKKYPNDNRPRKAIEAARNFANGVIAEEEMAIAAYAAAYAAFDTSSSAYCAAYAAYCAADTGLCRPAADNLS